MRPPPNTASHRHDQLNDELRQIVLDEVPETRVDVDPVEGGTRNEEVVGLCIAMQAGEAEYPSCEGSSQGLELIDGGDNQMIPSPTRSTNAQAGTLLGEVITSILTSHRSVIPREPLSDALKKSVLNLHGTRTQYR